VETTVSEAMLLDRSSGTGEGEYKRECLLCSIVHGLSWDKEKRRKGWIHIRVCPIAVESIIGSLERKMVSGFWFRFSGDLQIALAEWDGIFLRLPRDVKCKLLWTLSQG
jgi:hypothetical protein